MSRPYLFLILIIIFLGCGKEEIRKPSAGMVSPPPVPPFQKRDNLKTWDGSPNLEPGLNPDDILLFEDFEDGDYHKNWKVHWGKAVGAGTVESPSLYVLAGNRSAYLENKKRQHAAIGQGEYVPSTPIDEVAYFRLYIRLQDGFSMGTSNQLKLITIRGGVEIEKTYGGAGSKPDGRDKFSVDLCVDNSRSLHFYYYHPDQWYGYGDVSFCQISFFRSAKISRGKWHCLELMLRNNTPRQKNGQLSAWLDGRLVGNVERLRFRDSEAVKIRRFGVYNYFGGANVSDTSPQDQRIFIDNLVISRKLIGCFHPVT